MKISIDGPTKGECLDCKAPVVTGTVDGVFTIIHSGEMCEGFKARFTATEANPIVTAGMDERGNRCPSKVSKKAPPKLPEGKE